MCGIVGIVSREREFVTRERIYAASLCIRHRGPDDEGIWISPAQEAAFGHRRLSIIDLSDAAAQPMHYLSRYTIIHNGEVYNYKELKLQLQQKGYPFNSTSDTEVIAAAYDAWGKECVQYFDGMFSFAIWDEKEKKLFAARDRFGEKPFFFFYDETQLLFASEMKALWIMGVPKEVNRKMVYNFLTIGYTMNPGNPQETFYQHLHKLPPATYLEFHTTDHSLALVKYWQLNPDVRQPVTTNEAVDEFTHLFSSSIQKRLRSEVSIGTSLSGGLDSAAIVAFCNEHPPEKYTYQSFTASFPGFEKDETPYATLIANKFDLQAHYVKVDENEIVNLMQQVMKHQEEPFGSASVLAQFKVYQCAAQNNIKVLLDGQGADEVLGGYHKYYRWFWQELYRKRKLASSGELKQALDLGITENFSLQHKFAACFPEFSAAIWQGLKARKAFRHQELDRDFAFLHKHSLYHVLPASHDLNGALYFDTVVSGLEELLRLADRNSMAHGIEVRLPFLSHELVEFLFHLPPEMKIHHGWTKWLLRKTVVQKLPAEITWQRNKTGFEPPQKKWMQQADVREAIENAKQQLAAEGILKKDGLKKVQPHDSYVADNVDWKIWSVSYLFH